MGHPSSQPFQAEGFQSLPPFQAALKEWAVAVDALMAAETVVLLRKGGIREAGFKVDNRPFWLYPTYEHQKPELLKPNYANLVTTVSPGWHPGLVSIKAWAMITHQYELTEQGVCKVVCVKSLFLTLGTSLQIQLRSDLMRLSNYELAWSTSLRYCSLP